MSCAVAQSSGLCALVALLGIADAAGGARAPLIQLLTIGCVAAKKASMRQAVAAEPCFSVCDQPRPEDLVDWRPMEQASVATAHDADGTDANVGSRRVIGEQYEWATRHRRGALQQTRCALGNRPPPHDLRDYCGMCVVRT